MSVNAKIKAHRIFRYLEVNSSIYSSSIRVSIVPPVRWSQKTSVLVKFELFWFNVEVSMLLGLLKDCFVQYKTGGCEEEN